MDRNVFIAQTAAQILAQSGTKDARGVLFLATTDAIEQAQILADELERLGCAPWQKPPEELGRRSTCNSCGGAIEFEGRYWRHLDGQPRHIASPADEDEASSADDEERGILTREFYDREQGYEDRLRED